MGYGWFGCVGLDSSWFGSWYSVGATPMCTVLGYRWDAFECGSVLAIGVTPVSLWSMVTGSNPSVWSCLDVG
jgi:hypothetical protein